MTVPALIILDGVSVSYRLPGGGRRKALDDLSLEIREHEDLVILGAGGAGKTTLACLLAGAISPAEGNVVRGETLRPGDGAFLPVGLVTQNPEDTFTSPLVREEMGLVLENLDREDDEIDRMVEEMLAEVGLDGHADYPPSLLSGGQKQLLALASVLIAEPRLLLLDEPLSLLDPRGRREVEALVSRRGRPAGGAVVTFTSEVEEVRGGDRVVVLDRGRAVWQGEPGHLPLDEGTLSQWGLVVPDLTELGGLLGLDGAPGKSRLWHHREMARLLCRSN
jgi:energy-coupling factor transporter ATP-binding protein EcfA2